MRIFENKEFRRFTFCIAAVCVILIGVGFYISTAAGFLAIAICAVFYAAFFIFTLIRYQALAALSEQIDMILHGNDKLDMNYFYEGELYILASEIHKMTLRLREQSDALKKDKEFLSNSLADIAHQLRTPMTSIHILTSFLANPNLEAEQRLEFSRELEILLSRIDWLLATLLKVSKIDAGTAVFQKEKISVRTLLKKAAQPLEIPLELRGIELRMDCNESVSIIGDINWTAEAIGNILKNCMEHTPIGGKIEIECSQNTVFTEILIRDNGTGISDQDLPYIFERFYQGEYTKEGSFGIGLALCRMILSSQNATVKASDNNKAGACFTLRFYSHPD